MVEHQVGDVDETMLEREWRDGEHGHEHGPTAACPANCLVQWIGGAASEYRDLASACTRRSETNDVGGDSAWVDPIVATHNVVAQATLSASTAAAPAGTSPPAPGTPARASNPVRLWAGWDRGQGQGRWAAAAILGHTAAAAGAGGTHAGVDGCGMAARAGTGIDSGEDDILVDLNSGMGRTALGAVVGTGRCGGRGGSRKCRRRQRGARAVVDPFKRRRDEDVSDKRQSTIMLKKIRSLTVTFNPSSPFQPFNRLAGTPSNKYFGLGLDSVLLVLTKPGTYIHSSTRHIQPTGGTFGLAAGTFTECATPQRVAGTFALRLLARSSQQRLYRWISEKLSGLHAALNAFVGLRETRCIITDYIRGMYNPRLRCIIEPEMKTGASNGTQQDISDLRKKIWVKEGKTSVEIGTVEHGKMRENQHKQDQRESLGRTKDGGCTKRVGRPKHAAC
ncbi:hypothetical protein B0H13DRAFT_1907266 [Mycena leptocephala]|nr:hypothetical protein B0H13DRAFT_1907266 [Mycena leptocephala]